jgi:ABC-type Fe3+ transport system permease subunit
VAQTIVVCRLRTVLELGRPRKTMACPTANLLDSYFLDPALKMYILLHMSSIECMACASRQSAAFRQAIDNTRDEASQSTGAHRARKVKSRDG